jgi:asparagine synthase (glutamine-hydrolysing)
LSAIFGLIDLSGRPLDTNWILSMQSDLVHRGPDGHGLYREESVALGHMLLQVTPESVYDKSPYEEDGLVITAYARLDEREAIMDKLGITDSERKKITDPLLLLRSFRKFGKDFVKDIYGDFAFAIWDRKKKELFCGRDQMGVKPFLYFYQDNRFVFSTEIKSIVRVPCVSTSIDDSFLKERALGFVGKPYRTAWKNIWRLPAARTLCLKDRNIEICKYWEPKYIEDLSLNSNKIVAQKIQDLLKRIIADHIRVKGNVGAPLSGGLDSSTIACLAARQLKEERKKLFTVSSILDPNVPEDAKDNEIEYVNAFLQNEENVEPSFIYHTDLSFSDNLVETSKRHFSHFNAHHFVDKAIYEKIERTNTRRLISGYLGDITLSNRSILPLSHLLAQFQFRRYCAMYSHIRKTIKTKHSALILSKTLRQCTPIKILRLYNFLKNKESLQLMEKLPVFLRAAERQSFNNLLFLQNNHYSLNIADHIWSTDWECFYEDWDCGSSYHKIEITYPFIDRRLIELLVQIPVEFFYAEYQGRDLIRMTMKDLLPEKIRTRKTKGAYAPGLSKILQKSAPFIEELLVRDVTNNSFTSIIDKNKIIIDFKKSVNEKINIKFKAHYLEVLMLLIFKILQKDFYGLPKIPQNEY